MATDEHSPTLIQSVQRALRLVEAVAATDGRAQAKELARTVSLSLSTTYHLLRTLVHEGYLRRLDDGSYVLGPAFTQVTSQNRMTAVMSRARPAMQTLRDELKNPVYLALYVDGEIAVVEIVDSPKVHPRRSGRGPAAGLPGPPPPPPVDPPDCDGPTAAGVRDRPVDRLGP
jgi:IclR family acetate operon transcriptional repressor